MKYAFLIYHNEAEAAKATEEESRKEMGEYFAFTEAYRAAISASDALMPTSTATTVRVRDGKTLTTDGPFAETKEVLGGFYVIECANLDEAIAAASKIPGARHGYVEIRPVVVFQ